MPHRWDIHTSFCTRCGAAATEVVEGGARQFCQAEDTNVVGISHIVRGARLAALVGTAVPADYLR